MNTESAVQQFPINPDVNARTQILVVDDHRPTCNVLKNACGEIFSKKNIIGAYDLEEALQKFAQIMTAIKNARNQIDQIIVLTDLRMPSGHEGLDLITHIDNACQQSPHASSITRKYALMSFEKIDSLKKIVQNCHEGPQIDFYYSKYDSDLKDLIAFLEKCTNANSSGAEKSE